MFIHGQYCYIHYILPQNSTYPIFYAISNVNISYEKTSISVTIGDSFPLRIGILPTDVSAVTVSPVTKSV